MVQHIFLASNFQLQLFYTFACLTFIHWEPGVPEAASIVVQFIDAKRPMDINLSREEELEAIKMKDKLWVLGEEIFFCIFLHSILTCFLVVLF